MSKREKKNAEKRAAAKTDRAMEANKKNCPHCGVAFGAAVLDAHIALTHSDE